MKRNILIIAMVLCIGGVCAQTSRDFIMREVWKPTDYNEVIKRDVTVIVKKKSVESEAKPHRSILNSKVWEKEERHVRIINASSFISLDYVRASSADDEGNSGAGVVGVLSVGSTIDDVPSVRNVEGLSDLTKDMSGSTGGGTGFGEVPHDDANVPMGDGMVFLLVLVGIVCLVKY